MTAVYRCLWGVFCFLPFYNWAQTDVCNFNKYLQAKNTPQLAKDIYLGKKWNSGSNGNILAVLDSLKASDKSSRPFYFKVVSKSYSGADGGIAEGIGGKGKEYVEHNTREFLSYFNNEQCFTSRDLETWADIVVLELGLMAENQQGHSFFDGYIKTLIENCKDCSAGEKVTLSLFITLVKYNWQDYLIHSKAVEDSVLNCHWKDLSLKYDFKIDVKRIEFSYKVGISVIDKPTQKLVQVISLNSDVFENCNKVRSYITGKNINHEAIDNDFGDLVIGDFNFDSREDIAIKREAGVSAGPPYNFYIQDKNGRFSLDTFLSDTMIFFPEEINKSNSTLTTLVHSGAAERCKTTFKLDAIKNKWMRVAKTFVKY